MSRLTKTLLVLAIIGFVLGFIFVTGIINVESLNGLYVALPLGAVFFGLFLISKMLEKEVALHDDEQRNLIAAVSPKDPIRPQAISRRPTALAGAKAS